MNFSRYRSCIGLLTLIVLLAVIAPFEARARMIDGIVAVVDNYIIMDSDLQNKMEELGAPEGNRSAERQVLNLMVEDIVIGKIYKSMGLPPVGERDAKRFADSQKVSVETAKSFIMKSTLMDMMVRARVVITENMIRNYYSTHQEFQGRDSVRLRQILVKGNDQEGASVVKDLNSGSPVDEVLRKHADTLNATEIGWVAVEDLSEELQTDVEKSKPGLVMGPVTLDGGREAYYQYMEKGVIGKKSLDEVRKEIAALLEKKFQQDAFDHWLQKMMSEYFIGIYI